MSKGIAVVAVFAAILAVVRPGGAAVGALGTSSLATAPSTAPCSAAATEELVNRFVRNYAAGRIVVIMRMWAPEPRFQWFSAGKPRERSGREARNRATLAAYFRARIRARERLRLTRLGAGYDAKRHIVHFGGKLIRSARDMRRRPPQDFKGAADCVSRHPTFIVWSV
jgi:hypothetical protein